MSIALERRGFVDFIENNLTRTLDSGLNENPLKVFHIGLLRPLEDDTKNNTSKLRNSVGSITAPSSAGFSFFITGDNIHLSIEYGATYFLKKEAESSVNSNGKPLSLDEKKFIWQKVILSSDIHFLDAYQPNIEEKTQIVTHVFPNDESNLGHKGKLYQVWRPYKKGYMVTLLPALVIKSKL